jgi:3-isopropylmalate/(R)-2-methylmalate dehydratase small subunit
MSTTPVVRTGARTPFTVVTSTLAPLMMENVDTDQIIPARFLKITDSEGLGDHLFEDLRRASDGSMRDDFFLNRAEYRSASILLAGRNFGCGSSREHAPWALAGAGFRVVISTSFADIFHGNAMKNGLLPVALDAASWTSLAALVGTNARVTVDLERQEVRWPGGSARFQIDTFGRTCMLAGTDELGYILEREADISAYEKRQAVEEQS